MPTKPRRGCAYYGCPNLAVIGSAYCSEHKKLIDEQYDKHERHYVHGKRYGRSWQRKRNAYIEAHPYCELCMQNGIYSEASEVHHIKPLSDGGHSGQTNLMSLCHSCHMKIHRDTQGAI